MSEPSVRSNGRPAPVSLGLMTAALGVVFGDIGTSPLYAVRECFYSLEPSPQNILGIASLIFWAVTLVVTVKYLTIVMRADNRGEGGVLALMTLVQPQHRSARRGLPFFLMCLGIFGAALLYGDSTITPAISVLGAIEGLKVATPFFEPYVVPLTLVVLIALFMLQSRGTAQIGSLFGPIIFLWFGALALMGIRGVLMEPGILEALNPAYAISFFIRNSWHGFMALGGVFLCVTGTEALYADMGHFGLKPIRRAWLTTAMPGLLLNYFGQGALLLKNPAAVENPFYHLAPDWALYPLVALATAAAIIASQAVISGAFSLTGQAIKLGLLPRMQIHHTSSRQRGQIYIPQINWILLAATVWLVLEFGSASKLAAAYGIAVSTTMLITSMLIFVVAVRVWKWPLWGAVLMLVCFLLIDLSFWSANIIKVTHGGWFPLLVGVIVLAIMTTWHRGRQIVRTRLKERLPDLEGFVKKIPEMVPLKVPGTAVYMSTYREVTPPALLYNLKHNRVVHEMILILTVEVEEIPYVSPVRRVNVEPLGRAIFRVSLHFGFMDVIDVPRAMGLVKASGVDFNPAEAIYFLGRETILPTPLPGMALWREKLFAFMSRNPQEAALFFAIPPQQIVEIGFQVEI